MQPRKRRSLPRERTSTAADDALLVDVPIDAAIAAAPVILVEARPVSLLVRASQFLLEAFALRGPAAKRVRQDLAFAPAFDAAGRGVIPCVVCEHVLVVQLDPLVAADDLEALRVRHLDQSGWTFSAAGARCPECRTK